MATGLSTRFPVWCASQLTKSVSAGERLKIRLAERCAVADESRKQIASAAASIHAVRAGKLCPLKMASLLGNLLQPVEPLLQFEVLQILTLRLLEVNVC
jgi:hypothetical protein